VNASCIYGIFFRITPQTKINFVNNSLFFLNVFVFPALLKITVNFKCLHKKSKHYFEYWSCTHTKKNKIKKTQHWKINTFIAPLGILIGLHGGIYPTHTFLPFDHHWREHGNGYNNNITILHHYGTGAQSTFIHY